MTGAVRKALCEVLQELLIVWVQVALLAPAAPGASKSQARNEATMPWRRNRAAGQAPPLPARAYGPGRGLGAVRRAARRASSEARRELHKMGRCAHESVFAQCVRTISRRGPRPGQDLSLQMRIISQHVLRCQNAASCPVTANATRFRLPLSQNSAKSARHLRGDDSRERCSPHQAV